MSRQTTAIGKVMAIFSIVFRRQTFFLVCYDRLGMEMIKTQKADKTEMSR